MTATPVAVTLAQHLTPSDDVLAQEVGDEIVLLDLAGERYFGLDPVGTRIWALLPDCSNLDAVLTQLCAEFDAPREQIESDLLALAASLAETGLVTVD